jgi:hypothetical protein
MVLVVGVATASAQNYGTDARKIAMGGQGGDSTNIAAQLVEPGSPYTAIVLPLGLLQIFKDGLDKFKPGSPDFDPVHAIESISNPIHFTFGRGSTDTGQEFINNIRNGDVSTLLTSYAGFRVPTAFRAQGLAMPQGGYTLKFAKNSTTGAFQGVYIGAGPYLGFDTGMTVAQPLATMLSTGAGQQCSPCLVTNLSHVQLGMAITVGYRGHVALKSATSPRDGVYFAFNYHTLRGFRYLDDDILVRVDTNATGTLVAPPGGENSLSITSFQARKGTGRATDFGFVVVRNMFEVGFGVNGVGNQMDWSNFEQRTITINALNPLLGSNTLVNTVLPVSTVNALTVKMPIVISESLAFQAKGWGFMGALAQKKAATSSPGVLAIGYNEKSFHGGVERQVGPLWIRGGGRYSRDKWDPTYGFGIGNKIALDVGFYGTHANLEGKRQTTMAVSVRFNRSRPATPAATNGTK